jgi:hypothetical protein
MFFYLILFFKKIKKYYFNIFQNKNYLKYIMNLQSSGSKM